jgi:hypothetical protein
MSGVWDAVAGLFGCGGPHGNDHGSSNWAAWGHEEICAMLDQSVDPGDITETAQLWRNHGRNADDLVTSLAGDLMAIVSGGWRGASADAALAPLGAINQWSASHTEIADRTSQLMADSGSSAAQAKASVPPPRSHNWRESLLSFGTGGPAGALIDAVAQEQAQSDAYAEAVRIMTNVYSAPINDNRAAVPTYAQLHDPTQEPPEPMPTGEAVPGYSGGGTPAPRTGLSVAGHSAHTLSAPAALQAVTSPEHPAAHHGSGGVVTPDKPTRATQQGGGQIAAAAAAAVAGSVPIAAPIAENLARRPRAGEVETRAAGGARLAGGRLPGVGQVGGAGRANASQEFGPRPSSAAAEEVARGGNTAAAGRAAPGEMVAPMGAAGGKGGEDSEHRRPSYLIEMDDIFSDGRKVAPAVIGGDDPTGQGGS